MLKIPRLADYRPYPRPHREKVFGYGPARPMDRNAKTRVMTLARALKRRTEPGRHYGVLTAKALDVLEALLWGFHNGSTGRCFPSYERLAERAGCARSTVAEALKALEAAGLLSWVNRIVRVRGEPERDLFGRWVRPWRVIRTSNAYTFRDPHPATSHPDCCKSDFRIGTKDQGISDSSTTTTQPHRPLLDPNSPLEQALARLGAAFSRQAGAHRSGEVLL